MAERRNDSVISLICTYAMHVQSCDHVTHWLHYQHSPFRQPINKSNHFSQHSCKQDNLIPHLEIIRQIRQNEPSLFVWTFFFWTTCREEEVQREGVQGECSPCLSCKLSLWSFLSTLYQFWQFCAHDALCRFYHLVQFFFFFQQPCSWHIRWYSRSALSWLYSCWNLEEQGPLLLFPLQMGMCLQLSCNGQPENFQGFHYFHSFSRNVEQKLFSGLLKSITSSFIHNLVIHYFGTAWPGDPASSLLTCCLKKIFLFLFIFNT